MKATDEQGCVRRIGRVDKNPKEQAEPNDSKRSDPPIRGFFHWGMICSTADSFYRMSVQSVRRTGAPGNDTCGVRSGQNIPDYMAVNVRQTIAPALAPESKTFVVNAQKVQQGRLEVMHMHRIVCNVVPEIIGLAE